ncbi:MAG TPA: sigma-70 family RNA polymerase sigma factor [Bacteroidales bacterium]|jgi:RNA polymerase sigma factor (sigma-70 family)|nr:sigma-70 family RNA polymerase sigma factor [Bacteroidales bacterium]HPX79854.1 sigma-70 family RNA polymerase sigma factor [Bacteroidales bacterium]HQB23492.1 sigma-70 family RNA polymerase sigma factor [Bacteroidales bacterium]
MDQASFYREHHKSIYYTCLRIVRSPRDAEECMHDAFVKLFTRGNMHYINDKACYGWLKKVAVRGAIDRLRSLDFRMAKETERIDSQVVNRVFDGEEPDGTTNAEEKGEQAAALVVLIKELLHSFPSGYRTILSLYLFEGYDFEEIAEITKLKPASVRSAYSRGRRKLQEEIQHHGFVTGIYSGK